MSNEEINKKIVFKKLTPFIVEDEKSIYFKALDFALNESDIKNIAITGDYGSGKSTIWNSYKKYLDNKNDKEQFKTVTITLADYLQSINLNGDKKPVTFKETNIEQQILNQIVYQIDDNSIKYSKFLPKSTKLNPTLFLTIFILISSFLFLIFPNNLSILFHYINQRTLNFLSIFGLSFTSSIILKNIYKKGLFKIDKISIYGNEISTKDEKAVDIFNKEIDELIYLIKSSNTKIIIFEDLDRFKDISLFTRLKELNYVLNSKNDSIIRFIYLLKDDLFDSKDRIKFFDFIIPVVSFINIQNSNSKLVDAFSDVYIKPSEKILIRISRYLNEMRLINSIRNEYDIYLRALGSKIESLDVDKLFVLITFKNILPQEFNDLKNESGYVYNLLNKKEEITEKRIKSEKEQIESIKDEIRLLEKSNFENRFELIVKFIPTKWLCTSVDNSWFEVIKDLYNKRETNYSISISVNGSSKTYNYDQIVIELNKKEEFLRLYKLLDDDSCSESIKIKEAKISSIIENLNDFKNQTLSNLLNTMNELEINDFFSPKPSDISDNNILYLKFAILSGYIDDAFWFYTTYHHDGIFEEADEGFIFKLIEGSNLLPTYNIKNPKLVLEHLSIEDFNKYGIYNYNLLDYIVNNSLNDKICIFINNIIRNNRLSDFNDHLLVYDFEMISKFVTGLYNHDLDLFVKFIRQSDINDNIKSQILIFLYSWNKKIDSKVNDITSECSYILLGLDLKEINDFFSGISLNNVIFKKVSNLNIDDTISLKLMELKCFVFNIDNLMSILGTKKNKNLIVENFLDLVFDVYSFADIVPSKIENCNIFIEEYFEFLINNKVDKINCLNGSFEFINGCLNIKNSLTLINLQMKKIENINFIQDINLWTELIRNNNLELTTSNIENYFQSFRSEIKILIKFINENLVSNSNIQFPVDLSNLLINNLEIEIAGFQVSLLNFNNPIEIINKVLPTNRINLLIENKAFVLNVQNIELIYSIFGEEGIIKIVQFYEEGSLDILLPNKKYIDVLLKNVIEIIKIKTITEENVIKILTHSNAPVSIVKIDVNKKYIINYILENNFEINDLEYIVTNSKVFLELDAFITIMEKEEVLEKIKLIYVSKEMVEYIIYSPKATFKLKLYIIILSIKQLKNINYFEEWISNTEKISIIADVFRKRNPSISTNEEKLVSEALEKIGIITFSNNRIYLRPKKYKELFEKYYS